MANDSGTAEVASSLVPHCVFTGNTVCAGCWSQARAAHVCRALAAGGPHAGFASGVLELATCCVTVTLIPAGKKHVERRRICTTRGFENTDAGQTYMLDHKSCPVELNGKTKDIQSLQTHRQAEIPSSLWKNNSHQHVERLWLFLVYPESPACLSILFPSLSNLSFTNLPRSLSHIRYDFSPLVLRQSNNIFYFHLNST